jgi:hypothetical protein
MQIIQQDLFQGLKKREKVFNLSTEEPQIGQVWFNDNTLAYVKKVGEIWAHMEPILITKDLGDSVEGILLTKKKKIDDHNFEYSLNKLEVIIEKKFLNPDTIINWGAEIEKLIERVNQC